MNQTATWAGAIPAQAGSFNATLSGLTAGTTYYYRAVVRAGSEDCKGSVRSFTTEQGAAQQVSGYLEMPAPTSGSDYISQTLKISGVRNYSYLYDKSMYTALWCAYPLYKDICSGTGRSDNWSFNPNFSSNYQINVTSKSYSLYNQSSYSRGHQVPSGDRSYSSHPAFNAQTFYVTNQTPQLQNGFNGTIWESLEGAVRTVAQASSDTVYVATGAVFRTVGGNESITYFHSSSTTPSSLPVPNYYWKAVLKVKRSGNGITQACAVGFWFEHKAYPNQNWLLNVASIDEIEALTGFDLFANLPDDIEAVAEANKDWETFRTY